MTPPRDKGKRGSRIPDEVRSQGVSLVVHAVIVVLLVVATPLAKHVTEEIIEIDLVTEVVSKPAPLPPAPQKEPPPPPLLPPRPLDLPPPPATERPPEVPKETKVIKSSTPRPFSAKKPTIHTPAVPVEGIAIDPDAIEAPMRFELSMEAVVDGGSGIAVPVGGGGGAVYANPTLPGVSGGTGAQGTAMPEPIHPEVADTWEITVEPNPLNDSWYKPTYPPGLKLQGVEGQVTVRLYISAGGKVTAAEVVSSSHQGFDASALAYCKKLLFEPALAKDKPVASTVEWTVEYRYHNK